MTVTVKGGTMCEQEQQAYVDYMRQQHKDKIIRALEIEIDGEYVNLNFEYDAVPFQRIRMITGYLVGDLNRWNNAKYAEQVDRVKHGMKE